MARSLIRHPALPFACLAWTAGLLLGSLPAAAETVPAAPYNVSLCVFDFQGAKGDISRYARDLGLQAQRWNITLDIHSYTDERIAAEDFKAGQCDGVVMSTLRARAFNPFIGSIDSIGAAPDYRHIRALAATFDHPKINPLTINGDYQVVTIMPVGASYIMVNNRHIDSIDKALGKKVAVLDFDKPQSLIVQRLGAQAVPTDYYRFANKFNNGEVDIITAPALAVKPLELERGMGDYGGIYRLPLTQVTGALLINRTRLQKTIPDLDARIHTLRRLALPEMDKAIAYIRRQEQAIPAGLWLDFPPAEQEKYVHMMRDTRIRLTREGYYDGRMMALMKKVRCHYDPASYECALNDE
ncbi:hypothetical protein EV700_1013 [Fluviicoccus keumensis]|uniref:TRAP-type C4-dicarboxylate transport system substrate-binding protein n=1 Tax=Fluviicoccus keumensis TaxID=1435465 RepID=A0A4Q7ZBP2_9GAMM|nr:putative solute-binding protein [Fluviicoccus keumensis]RZU48042.1 hypothetical protein EV700_1013 [Fluviicoccus keumensis]